MILDTLNFPWFVALHFYKFHWMCSMFSWQFYKFQWICSNVFVAILFEECLNTPTPSNLWPQVTEIKKRIFLFCFLKLKQKILAFLFLTRFKLRQWLKESRLRSFYPSLEKWGKIILINILEQIAAYTVKASILMPQSQKQFGLGSGNKKMLL